MASITNGPVLNGIGRVSFTNEGKWCVVMSLWKKFIQKTTRLSTKSAYDLLQQTAPSPFSILWSEAAHSSADLIRSHLETSLLFRNRREMHHATMAMVADNGMLLEFGVHKGLSTNYFANFLLESGDARRLYGFDSFEGLSENWTGFTGVQELAFDRKGVVPKVPDNVTLIKGWIEKTLPDFLQRTADDIAFIHIDTDTYSPAATILKACKPQLMSGTLILFDELIGYPNWQNHEFKALNENLAPDQFEYVAFSNNQVLIQIV